MIDPTNPLTTFLVGFLLGAAFVILLAQAAWYDWEPRERKQPEQPWELDREAIHPLPYEPVVVDGKWYAHRAYSEAEQRRTRDIEYGPFDEGNDDDDN